MTTITNITNNGDGTYSVTFSGPVSVIAARGQPNFLFYNPGGASWSTCTCNEPHGTYTTIVVTEDNGDTTCTLAVILQSLNGITATPPIQIATPVNLV